MITSTTAGREELPVRALLRSIFTRSARPVRYPAGEYRSVSYVPLRPSQVRGRQFTITRRGLDPDEVNAFLDRVAADLSDLYAELAISREETMRIKNALREWQPRQAPSMYELASR